jgi:hypothetical protein
MRAHCVDRVGTGSQLGATFLATALGSILTSPVHDGQEQILFQRSLAVGRWWLTPVIEGLLQSSVSCKVLGLPPL